MAAVMDGTELELDVQVSRPTQELARLTGPVGRRVRRHRADLVATAAGRGVSGMRVFGSVARGQDRPDSDLDLLVNLPVGMGLLALGRLRADLEAIVGSPVDLVPESDLKPDVRERVAAELVAL